MNRLKPLLWQGLISFACILSLALLGRAIFGRPEGSQLQITITSAVIALGMVTFRVLTNSRSK